MKFKELQKESDEQIVATLNDTEKHLFQLRFQSATDRLETPSEIRKAKRDIARIKTLQRQRELVELDTATAAELKTIQELAAKGERAPGKPFVGKRKAKRVLSRVDKLLGVAPAKKGK
jgi:large subunit ribosomal protein L29